MLKLLAEGSNDEESHFNDDSKLKYILKDKDDLEYFRKSRANKDKAGNNSCHLAFEMVRDSYRYKFLELLIEEKIGDINKPNVLGLLPHQIEHH